MKRMLVSGAVLALAVAGISSAQATPAVYKVTGGGQIINLETQSGAGDTIAFSAQSQGESDPDAKGQIQFIDRIQDPETGKGTGKGQTVHHADVTCVVVLSPAAEGGEGGMAVIGGKTRDGRDIRIDVTDNGQGQAMPDLVQVRFDEAARDGGDTGSDSALCDEEDEDATMQLGRGNVQIHKGKAPAGE